MPKFPYEVIHAFDSLQSLINHVEEQVKRIETGYLDSDDDKMLASELASYHLVLSDTKIGVGKHIPVTNILQWQEVEKIKSDNLGKRIVDVVAKINGR